MLTFQTGLDERRGMNRGGTKVTLRLRAGMCGVRTQRGFRAGDRMQGGFGPGHAGRQSIGPRGMGAAGVALFRPSSQNVRP